MTPREKVAKLLSDALHKKGFSGFSEFDVCENIWTPMGGERSLDIARWDISIRCEHNDYPAPLPLHVHSWCTLSDFKSCKKMKLTPHSHREFEASPMANTIGRSERCQNITNVFCQTIIRCIRHMHMSLTASQFHLRLRALLPTSNAQSRRKKSRTVTLLVAG